MTSADTKLADLQKEAAGAPTNVRVEVRLLRDAAAPWPPTVMAGAVQPLSLKAQPVAVQAETAVRVAMIFSCDSGGALIVG